MSDCCNTDQNAHTEPDILVIGGGSAGFSAAITAADACLRLGELHGLTKESVIFPRPALGPEKLLPGRLSPGQGADPQGQRCHQPGRHRRSLHPHHGGV